MDRLSAGATKAIRLCGNEVAHKHVYFDQTPSRPTLMREVRMSRGVTILPSGPLIAAICMAIGALSLGSHSMAADAELAVRPIRWERFQGPVKPNPDLDQAGDLLLNAARYGGGWIEATYKEDPGRRLYAVANKNHEYVIRGPASAAWGLAVALKTGLFDEKRVGVSREELTRRTTWLIKGVAAIHKANPGGIWGDHWQSAMWTEHLGSAAWLMWDDLDEEARAMVYRMIVHEADRFIQSGYQVPYWNTKGGDTKAEENAWNTMSLQLAVAMFPSHPHVARWKTICSELMVSAYARESDMSRTDITLDGRTPKEWLQGYNLREDGTLVNHNRIHNDYMATIAALNMRAFTLCSLAEIAVPEACDFNFDVIYRAFVTLPFASPPYKPPGGTMYVPGKAEQYYPEGTDWGAARCEVFYLMDIHAHLLGYDQDLPHKAQSWMRLRAQKMLAMQSRHADGRVFAEGEFTPGAMSLIEQVELWSFGSAYLVQWLHAHGALSEQANWLQ
jgi:hypothetical protein